MNTKSFITAKLSEALSVPVEQLSIERLYHNWARHYAGHCYPSWAANCGTRVFYCDYTMREAAKAIKDGKKIVIRPAAFCESAEEIEFK